MCDVTEVGINVVVNLVYNAPPFHVPMRTPAVES
jgi:hypothetical protein